MLRSVANARSQNSSVVSFTQSLTKLGPRIRETGKKSNKRHEGQEEKAVYLRTS